MTASQKILIQKMLTGHFLRKMQSRNHTRYVLYDDKINPVLRVRPRTVEQLNRYIKNLWKKNKRGDITLNLNTVRQLHGRHTIKKMYKQREQLTATGAIYKTRSKQTKKQQADEKIYNLFG